MLTDKEKAFVYEYPKDKNAAAAARRAGFSKKTARQIGFELLKKPEIADAIEGKLAKLEEQADVSALDVLREWKRIGLSNIADVTDASGNLLPIKDMPLEIQRCISSIEVDDQGKKKIRLHDKNTALTNLGKYFKLNRETVDVNTVISFGERLRRAREKRLGKPGA